MRRLLPFLILFIASNAWAAFGYYSPISINSAQVPSTQTDFPVLVSVTDARFKTVANSGHVQNSSGFDIRPYTDSTLSTAITGYELERYNASTGEVIMWVKVSSLSSSTTPFVLAYGDSGISTNGSSTTTWSNSFRGVYHLKDGTSLSGTDSTSGAFNGTVHSATATTGQIDGAGSFSGTSQNIDSTGMTGTWAQNVDTTISCWFKTSTTGTNMVPISKGTTSGGWYLIKNTANTIGMNIKDSGGTVQLGRNTTSTVTDGSWHYIACTFHINTSSTSGQDVQVYLDGALNQGTLTNTAATADATAQTLDIGSRAGPDLFWTGSIDEVRIANSVARSANWVATEFNNQSAPGTFETLGTEVALGVTNKGFFYFFP